MDTLMLIPSIAARMWRPLWRTCSARGTFVQDILASVVSNGAVLAFSLATYGLVARRFDETDLGQYMLLRRVIQSIMPVLMLGMPVALSRQVALAGVAAPAAKFSVALTSCVVLASTAVFSIAAVLFPATSSSLLLGGDTGRGILQPMLLWLAGVVWSQQLYALYMGRMQVRLANVVQVCCGALAPFLPLMLWPQVRFGMLLLASGWLAMAFCLAFTPGPAIWLMRDSLCWRRDTHASTMVRQILSYGISRVPGFAAMGAMWTAVPLLVLSQGAVDANTYIMSGIQALLMVSLVLQPVSSVLLPRVAEMHSSGQDAQLHDAMSRVLNMLVDCGIVLLMQVPVLVPVMLKCWLLLDAPDGIIAATLIGMAIPACVCFNVVRNPVDAISPIPYNTYILLGALALQLGLYCYLESAGCSHMLAGSIAVAVSFIMLGIAAWLVTWRLFSAAIGMALARRLPMLAVLAVVSMLAGLGITRAAGRLTPGIQILIVCGFEMVVAACCLAALVKLRTPWTLILVRAGRMAH